MKKTIIACILAIVPFLGAMADVDPNFYIYLCFGQSNMEGNAKAETVDKANVDKRFRLLATCNYSSPKRNLGEWYDAVPPLVNPIGSLGPTDYFGRTMVAALPANVRIGVVPVAIGGCTIEMFDKDKYKTEIAKNDYSAGIAKDHYGSNPYKRLVDMAKKAQEVGVIKGILLHQGCSNNGQSDWPDKVKKIYNDILKDLGLSADSVPLFVGETLRQENGGACYGHNTQVARMPSVVKTSYVISSYGCPGNGNDPWHFNATGYRIIGKRYAFAALKVLGVEPMADPDYQMAASLKKFFEVKSVKDFFIKVGDSQKIIVNAVYGDGHTENITSAVTPTFSNITLTNGKFTANTEMADTASVEYTDFSRKQASYPFIVGAKFFPFDAANISQLAGTLTYDEAKHGIQLTAGGQAGWKYSKPIDFSSYKYLVVRLKQKQTCRAEIRISSSNNTGILGYRDTINDRTMVVIDLHNMKYNNTVLDPANIRMVSLRCGSAGTVYLSDVYVTNENPDPTGIAPVNRQFPEADDVVFTLQGMKVGTVKQWNNLPRGIYIMKGKIVQKR